MTWNVPSTLWRGGWECRAVIAGCYEAKAPKRKSYLSAAIKAEPKKE
jgi:hypothetical protein